MCNSVRQNLGPTKGTAAIQFLTDQATLFQPGGQITTCIGFSDLPTALCTDIKTKTRPGAMSSLPFDSCLANLYYPPSNWATPATNKS